VKASAEAIRFAVAGAVNTAGTLVLYWCLLLVAPYQIAYTVTYVIGIGLAYWLNTRFVFRVAATPRTAAVYPIVYVVGYLVGLGALHVAVELLGWPRAVGILLSTVVTVPTTFLLTRAILTRSRRARADDGGRAGAGAGARIPDPDTRPAPPVR